MKVENIIRSKLNRRILFPNHAPAYRDNDKLYLISYAIVNSIDVFIRNEYKDVLLESWHFCRKEKGLEIYGWVVMTLVVRGDPSEHPEQQRFTAKAHIWQ
jgi:hypothetical protein